MSTPSRRFLIRLAWVALLGIGVAAHAQSPDAAAQAATLQAKFQSLQSALSSNPFKRKLALESTESSNKLAGDIYAVIDHPFNHVSDGLKTAPSWCEVLMLHLNTKNCQVQGGGASPSLAVALGRKFDQPLSDAQVVKFSFRQVTVSPEYLDVRLGADEGPLSTRDYRIELTATPIPNNQTFIHLSYSYAYGTAARLAMQAYLATIGSDKVGFTATGRDAQGKAQYIGGVRGVVERNTMRYYLAIDSYLDQPGAGDLDKRLAAWFDGTEQYALQLHETERADYLTMKQNEFKRMKGGS